MRPVALFAAFLIASCGGASDPPEKAAAPEAPPPNTIPILITRRDQVDGAVGKLVTVEGDLDNSKIRDIVGVEVNGGDLGPAVKKATATGVLRKSVTTQEELDREFATRGIFATSGAGTYYHLVDPATGRISKARALP